ncbi:MAG: methionine adenosyltransferase domain-containing protein, partial [bacterium]
VEYVNGKPKRIHTVVLSTQHDEKVSQAQIKKDLTKLLILPTLPKRLVDKNLIIHVNPTGRFVVGGPHGDTGLTGRKIIVDTYGGMGRHGGGAFSGKDPSKVDRSAAYAMRWIAKNVVAAGLAKKCEVQVSYAIGVAKPISLNIDTVFSIDTQGTGRVEDSKIRNFILRNVDLSPAGIIQNLKLRQPIYRATAVYGHFGRNEKSFTWEKTNLVPMFKRLLK